MEYLSTRRAEMAAPKYETAARAPSRGSSVEPAPIPASPPSSPIDAQALNKRLRASSDSEQKAAFECLRDWLASGGVLPAVLVPAVVNGLGTPQRRWALKVLDLATHSGFDPTPFLPVIAGLLLDRDDYDDWAAHSVLRLLLSALRRGCDISLAWPWLCVCRPEGNLAELCETRLALIREGLESGLPQAPVLDWLLGQLRLCDPRKPTIVVGQAACTMFSALQCLAIAEERAS